MKLTRASHGRRLIVDIDFRLTQQDLILVFLWNATTMDTDQLRVVPPTRQCLRLLQIALWLRGVDGLRTDTTTSQTMLDWAGKCADRVWNSRQIEPEDQPTS